MTINIVWSQLISYQNRTIAKHKTNNPATTLNHPEVHPNHSLRSISYFDNIAAQAKQNFKAERI